MTRFQFSDGETSVDVSINQDRVSLEEAIATFQDFLEDVGYDLDGGYLMLAEA